MFYSNRPALLYLKNNGRWKKKIRVDRGPGISGTGCLSSHSCVAPKHFARGLAPLLAYAKHFYNRKPQSLLMVTYI